MGEDEEDVMDVLGRGRAAAAAAERAAEDSACSLASSDSWLLDAAVGVPLRESVMLA
jgi:hypothetical protein